MRFGHRIPYGLLGTKLVGIADVKNGKACNCFCPSCHQRLIAKNNPKNKREHHFAHESKTDCTTGYESALHIMAKEILSEGGEIALPQYSINIKLGNGYYSYTRHIKDYHKTILKPDYVECEKKLPGMVADLYIQKKNKFNKTRELIVEFYVTHKVDAEKMSIIKNNKISAIEVDLSRIDRTITKEELKKLLSSDATNVSWLFNIHQEKERWEEQNKLDEEVSNNIKNKRKYFFIDEQKNKVLNAPCKKGNYLNQNNCVLTRCQNCNFNKGFLSFRNSLFLMCEYTQSDLNLEEKKEDTLKARINEIILNNHILPNDDIYTWKNRCIKICEEQLPKLKRLLIDEHIINEQEFIRYIEDCCLDNWNCNYSKL